MTDDAEAVISFLKARASDPEQLISQDGAEPDAEVVALRQREFKESVRTAVSTYEKYLDHAPPELRQEGLDQLMLTACYYMEHPDFNCQWLVGAERARNAE